MNDITNRYHTKKIDYDENEIIVGAIKRQRTTIIDLLEKITLRFNNKQVYEINQELIQFLKVAILKEGK